MASVKFSALEVETVKERLGLVVAKVAAVGGASGYDAEQAFYDMLTDSRQASYGQLVTGWWFPAENVGRVAFKPADKALLKAKPGTAVEKSIPAPQVRRNRLSMWQ